MGKLGRAPSESKQSRGRASRSRGAEPAQGSRETGLSASWPWASRRDTLVQQPSPYKGREDKSRYPQLKILPRLLPLLPNQGQAQPKDRAPCPGLQVRVQGTACGRGLLAAWADLCTWLAVAWGLGSAHSPCSRALPPDAGQHPITKGLASPHPWKRRNQLPQFHLARGCTGGAVSLRLPRRSPPHTFILMPGVRRSGFLSMSGVLGLEDTALPGSFLLPAASSQEARPVLGPGLQALD